MCSEAAFAHLTGLPRSWLPSAAPTAPPHRGGDRAANNALHTIVLTRMRFDERTRAYAECHTKEGLNKKGALRRPRSLRPA
ncbi:hypothetical protein ACGFYM_40795 [Streptomyces sp. NPDC048231]|uniref:hypothetical protein n=1 Tax=Streptomyces sp. NPDC048231 TaxID=3365519 RepID=UPI0037136FB0